MADQDHRVEPIPTCSDNTFSSAENLRERLDFSPFPSTMRIILTATPVIATSNDARASLKEARKAVMAFGDDLDQWMNQIRRLEVDKLRAIVFVIEGATWPSHIGCPSLFTLRKLHVSSETFVHTERALSTYTQISPSSIHPTDFTNVSSSPSLVRSCAKGLIKSSSIAV